MRQLTGVFLEVVSLPTVLGEWAVCVPDTVNRWLGISGWVASETQVLPAWRLQGEPELLTR